MKKLLISLSVLALVLVASISYSNSVGEEAEEVSKFAYYTAKAAAAARAAGAAVSKFGSAAKNSIIALAKKASQTASSVYSSAKKGLSYASSKISQFGKYASSKLPSSQDVFAKLSSLKVSASSTLEKAGSALKSAGTSIKRGAAVVGRGVSASAKAIKNGVIAAKNSETGQTIISGLKSVAKDIAHGTYDIASEVAKQTLTQALTAGSNRLLNASGLDSSTAAMFQQTPSSYVSQEPEFSAQMQAEEQKTESPGAGSTLAGQNLTVQQQEVAEEKVEEALSKEALVVKDDLVKKGVLPALADLLARTLVTNASNPVAGTSQEAAKKITDDELDQFMILFNLISVFYVPDNSALMQQYAALSESEQAKVVSITVDGKIQFKDLFAQIPSADQKNLLSMATMLFGAMYTQKVTSDNVIQILGAILDAVAAAKETNGVIPSQELSAVAQQYLDAGLALQAQMPAQPESPAQEAQSNLEASFADLNKAIG